MAQESLIKSKALRFAMLAALGRRLTKQEGTARVVGVHRPVTITRDAHGVPFIEASHEDDAWFALGYCHAQDRAMQLEILVRAVRGTLSELLGKDGLAMDRLARRIGFRRAARAQFVASEVEVRTQTESYVRGINAGRLTGRLRRPHELALLGSDPTAWEAEDVFAYLSFLCFALASNWDQELLRLAILLEDGPRALQALDTKTPPIAHAISPVGEAVGERIAQLRDELSLLAGFGGGGSNAWVIGKERTKDGMPILANDPHLPAQLPNPLYLVRVGAPGFRAVGASFVGTPAIASGHNGHAAWGVTAAHADNTDLFIEEIRLGEFARESDGESKVDVFEEKIVVRGQKEPVTERVLVTRRGPVIAAQEDGQTDKALARGIVSRRLTAISMSATWLRPRPQRGLFRVHHVRSFASFRRLFEHAALSSVSMVYADVTGKIGWTLGVEMPIRKRGSGLIPLPAWAEGAGWEAEPAPFEGLPYDEDPALGYFAAANNQPLPSGASRVDLGCDFLDGYRQTAISEALSKRSDWDLASVAALQRDTRSIPWEAIRSRVLSVEPSSANAKRARMILSDWDGRVAADSIGASIYEAFFASVVNHIVYANAPRTAAFVLGKGPTAFIPYASVLTRRAEHFVRELHRMADADAVIERAFEDAIELLTKARGDDEASWKWGNARPLILKHPFGQKPPFDRIFDVGPLKGEGDANTISQGQVDLTNVLNAQISVPASRALIHIGRWEESRFSLCGGQSGNPLSPHYDDLIRSWEQDGIAIPWDELPNGKVLKLEPR
jgi:penicillin G amidase